MMTVKEINLAMPQPEYWIKSEKLLNTLEEKLFESPKIEEKEANQYYDKFYQLIKSNQLTVSNISLFEQRVLSSLLFPKSNKDNQYLMKMENCWPQIQRIILNRYDTQTIEILCEKVSNCNASLIPNFSTVIVNIESILVSCNTIRLRKARRLLKIEVGEDKQLMSWGDSIKHRSAHQQLAVFKAFEQFAKAEYSEKIIDKSLFISRNNFWKYYFKNGLVKQSTLLVIPKKTNRVEIYSDKIITLTGISDDQFGIMFHLGDRVFIEWANPAGFHSINESDHQFPDFTKSTIDFASILDSEITKHRANAYYYWQYRIAFSLRSSTGLQPSRADYQLSRSG